MGGRAGLLLFLFTFFCFSGSAAAASSYCFSFHAFFHVVLILFSHFRNVLAVFSCFFFVVEFYFTKIYFFCFALYIFYCTLPLVFVCFVLLCFFYLFCFALRIFLFQLNFTIFSLLNVFQLAACRRGRRHHHQHRRQFQFCELYCCCHFDDGNLLL